jgi:DNA mismatch repair protein MutL
LSSPGRYTKQIAPDETSENGDDSFYPHYESPLPPHLRDDARARISDDPTALPDGLGTPQRPRTLPILRVVGQITASYIVAEGPSGMYLIDQHAAHERILYEQFMAAYQNKQLAVQGVLDTITVELGALQARVLEEYQEQLAEIGFEIEEFGKNTYRIRSVPALLSDRDPAEVLYQLLDDAERCDEPGKKSIEAKIVRRICKAASIKAGQVLSHAEMQGIIRQLERCENPHTCPHGRPTLLHLSKNQLEKEFGRT